jgi:hypothetical protein
MKNKNYPIFSDRRIWKTPDTSFLYWLIS